MRVGEVARGAGSAPVLSAPSEEQGLLDPQRTGGGQRTCSDSAVERVRLIQRPVTAVLPSRTVPTLLPCIESRQASRETSALVVAGRDRITTATDDLAAARDALDRMIEGANLPTPEHYPALRDPAWAVLRTGALTTRFIAAAQRRGDALGPRADRRRRRLEHRPRGDGHAWEP